MKKVLHIIASPRNGRSHSRKVSNYFIDKLFGIYPDIQLEELDLELTDLPDFGKPGVFAKYKNGEGLSLDPEEREQWEGAKSVWLHFQSADAYVFSVPMWNFSIPHRLKHYIDLITQNGWAFRATDAGYEGLMAGKRAFISFAAGGNYDLPETAQLDFMRPYMRFWTRFVGLEVFDTINHSTNLDADHDAIFRQCQEQVDELIGNFNPEK